MRNKKIQMLTNTALMLALLIILQLITKSFGQIVTGSCVNCVLAISCLLFGNFSAITIALISPFLAYLFGIGPQFIQLTICISLGNLTYVLLISLLNKSKQKWMKYFSIVIAALAKYLVLYLTVVKLVGPMILNEKQLSVIAVSFGFTQFITATIGGYLALFTSKYIRR